MTKYGAQFQRLLVKDEFKRQLLAEYETQVERLNELMVNEGLDYPGPGSEIRIRELIEEYGLDLLGATSR